MSKGIEKAIQAAGSQAKLADLLAVTRSAVNQWRSGESPIPAKRCLQIWEAFPEITLHELRPDIYPE